MIIVMPTTTGILVGIDRGSLIKHGRRRAMRVTSDDLHRFQTIQSYLHRVGKESSKRDSKN